MSNFSVPRGVSPYKIADQMLRAMGNYPEAERFFTPPGRRRFARKLWLKRQVFVSNSGYLAKLAETEFSKSKNVDGKKIYKRKYDPFHPFIPPVYELQSKGQEQAAEAAAAAAVPAETPAKSSKGENNKNNANKKGEKSEKEEL